MTNRKSMQTLISTGVLKEPLERKDSKDLLTRDGGHRVSAAAAAASLSSSSSSSSSLSSSNVHSSSLSPTSSRALGIGSEGGITSEEKDRTEMFRRMSELTEFLARRPSLDELVNANVVEDVMTWTKIQMEGVIPRPRNCHSACQLNDRMYLAGGYGTGSTSIDLLVMDTTTQHWFRPLVGGVVPSERYSHTVCAWGTHLLVFGGFSVTGKWMNDLHALDTEYKQEFVPSLSVYGSSKAQHSPMLMWYQPEFTGDPPACRAGHASVVIGHKMYIFGGNNHQRLFNDLHVLDIREMRWSQSLFMGQAPSARAGHAMVAVDKCGHSMCVIRDNQLLVFAGGYQQKIFNDLHMFDMDTYTWSRPSDTGAVPCPRAGHSCVVSADNVVRIFGGGDVERELFNDFYVLDTGYFCKKDEISKLILAQKNATKAKSKACSGVGSAATGATMLSSASTPSNKLPVVDEEVETDDHDVQLNPLNDDPSSIMDANDMSSSSSSSSSSIASVVGTSANSKVNANAITSATTAKAAATTATATTTTTTTTATTTTTTSSTNTATTTSGTTAATATAAAAGSIALAGESDETQDDKLFAQELETISLDIETYVTDTKKDIEKKITEFRNKERTYLNLLKTIDTEREKLVVDIVEQCQELQKQTKARLDDLNAKYMARLLRREVSQLNSHLNPPPDKVEPIPVPSNSLPFSSVSSSTKPRERKFKGNRAKSVID
ncbi:hypothetical protein RFI_16512 [Reticulomyxa filosa]|uniref:Kelch repeat-containing protein n=1 Tax=Reticulomyxa filosa TaxID=46433 RepID=X6N5V8_RETFI|nr:hypothetical protein RFI_16512 [Reticulomyxa filosa]|eukprot:ETO20702.1 hypothetical protein RFI_16512 [Reticulomyxa filosa]